jgi:prepilin-type N-terminal cleavage/methylation domain-containing protein/prepilin-type processing-associated H-X9-DG protein
MKRTQGFTLTELLVVVVVVALLLGLLLPAVQSPRGMGGRRAQCLNNMKNCSLAVLHYEAVKQKFPPSYTRYRNSPASPSYLGWVAQVLPYLERTDVYERFNHGKNLAAPDANSLDNQPIRIDFLICPSAGTANPAPIHYAVNCGRQDFSSPSAAVDWQENGVFFTDFAPTEQIPVEPINLQYVANHDGTSMTLLMAENEQTQKTWNEPQPLTIAPLEGLSGILWFPSQPVDSRNKPIGFDRSPTDFPKTASGDFDFAAPTAPHYALPSSQHPGLFNAAFCDGSVRCIDSTIAYRIYALAMTPNGKEAREPSIPPSPLTEEHSPEYRGWITKPLQPSDFE